MANLAPVEQVRKRLAALVARPALPEGVWCDGVDSNAPAPPGLTSEHAGDVVWERWRAHTEPGALGVVPVLLARPRCTQAGRRACVVVLHGTLNSKEDFADHLARYAEQGFVAVSFDTRYRGERGTLEDYFQSLVRAWRSNHAGPEASAPGAGDEHPFMYDSVWDFMRVVDLLVVRPDIDASRIGATGVSLGGMHVWLAAAADRRVAAAAPAIGVQGYRYALERGCWQARIDTILPVFEAAAGDLRSPITGEVVEQVWRRICPGLLDELDAPSSLRCIAPRPLLVVNGALDPRCPAEGVRDAVRSAAAEYARLGAQSAVRLHLAEGVAHEVDAAMWRAIDDFLAEHLRPQEVAPAETPAPRPRKRATPDSSL